MTREAGMTASEREALIERVNLAVVVAREMSRDERIIWLENARGEVKVTLDDLANAAAELSRLAKENGRWRKAVSQAVNDCAEDAAANADLSKRCQSDEDAAFRDGKQEAYSQMQRQLSAILSASHQASEGEGKDG